MNSIGREYRKDRMKSWRWKVSYSENELMIGRVPERKNEPTAWKVPTPPSEHEEKGRIWVSIRIRPSLLQGEETPGKISSDAPGQDVTLAPGMKP
jgi:hypothetical protein